MCKGLLVDQLANESIAALNSAYLGPRGLKERNVARGSSSFVQRAAQERIWRSRFSNAPPWDVQKPEEALSELLQVRAGCTDAACG